MIGAGAVADYHHVPGIRLDPRAELVAACDPNAELLEERQSFQGKHFEQLDGKGVKSPSIATPLR